MNQLHLSIPHSTTEEKNTGKYFYHVEVRKDFLSMMLKTKTIKEKDVQANEIKYF